MPLIQDIIISNRSRLGIWEISETLDFYKQHLVLSDIEKAEIAMISHKGRQREWFAARRLLMDLMDQTSVRSAIIKDKFGKPHYEDSSLSLSISHSGHFVSAMVSPKNCGIDIQVYDERLKTLLPKFVSEPEKKFINPACELIDTTLIWSIKEAVYKAFGAKNLDFKQHIRIREIKGDKSDFTGLAEIEKDAIKKSYLLDGYCLNAYIVVAALEL